jgi:hypothetical protein
MSARLIIRFQDSTGALHKLKLTGDLAEVVAILIESGDDGSVELAAVVAGPHVIVSLLRARGLSIASRFENDEFLGRVERFTLTTAVEVIAAEGL